MPINCPHCDFENHEDDRFCVECGQSLYEPVAAPALERPRRRRRCPWFLLLALILLVGAAAAVHFDLVPLPSPIASLFGQKAPDFPDVEIVGTGEPFLVLQAAADSDLEVIVTDVVGNYIATIGPNNGVDSARFVFYDPEYAAWSTAPVPQISGASAWAWPRGRSALVALHAPEGWDLLRYDASIGEIREIVQAAEYLQVSGHVKHDRFLLVYSQDGEWTLVGGDPDEEEAIEFLDRAESITESVISSDGRYVAFLTDDLYVASTEGRRTYRQPGEYQSLVYAPDGRYLFYSSGHQLIRADADGRNARIIAEVGRNDRLWPFSVGQAQLAALQTIGDSYDVRVMTLDGRSSTRLGRSDASYSARYLPGQQGLLIVQGSGPTWSVELTDPAGEGRRDLARDVQGFAVHPLRDGRHIALAYQQDNRWQLMLYDTREDEQQGLERDLTQLWILATNERHLVYSAQFEDDWSLLAVDLRNKETSELDSGSLGGYPIAFFSIDGKEVIYEAREETVAEFVLDEDGTTNTVYHILGGVYAVDLEDLAPRPVYEGANLLAASLSR